MPAVTLDSIHQFLATHRIAIVGVSRNEKDYSRHVLEQFLSHGYDAVPLHPEMEEVSGIPCFRHIGDVHPKAEAALLLVPEHELIAATRQCIAAGIRHIWFRHSGDSNQYYRIAVAEAREKGANVVDGECPLMYLPNVAWFHRAHAFLSKVTGAYPH